jgi:antitoxin MazE
MQVSKWGNSLAIRLPAAVVEVLGLKEGDHIEVSVAGRDDIAVRRSPSNREVLQRLRKYRGLLPADFKFDRLEAYGDRG